MHSLLNERRTFAILLIINICHVQTQGMRPGVVPYVNAFSALKRIAHEEGLRGLYRLDGMTTSIIAGIA